MNRRWPTFREIRQKSDRQSQLKAAQIRPRRPYKVMGKFYGVDDVKILKWIATAITALVVGYAAFLTWRIAHHWDRAPEQIAQILAEADPSLDAISQERISWLIRVEDPTFWDNHGIDLSTPGAGMTTLAQSLGKRIFFERFSPGLGKLELMVLTRFVLIERVSKPDILRAFLSEAYLGNDQSGPVIGFAEGARRWFGKELAELEDREFLALVAMLPSPNRLDPINHPSNNDERVRRIERLLAGQCEPINLNDVYYERCASP